MRVLVGALVVLAMLQTGGAVAAGAVAAPPRSCVVPMPCCDEGFCPLHAHGSHRHSNSGPRWLRCDDHVPMSTPPATGPLAVLARTAGVPLPRFAHALSPMAPAVVRNASHEPELPPPDLLARLLPVLTTN
jgi:hypothetical protein